MATCCSAVAVHGGTRVESSLLQIYLEFFKMSMTVIGKRRRRRISKGTEIKMRMCHWMFAIKI
jgi:hypothetical protein